MRVRFLVESTVKGVSYAACSEADDLSKETIDKLLCRQAVQLVPDETVPEVVEVPEVLEEERVLEPVVERKISMFSTKRRK